MARAARWNPSTNRSSSFYLEPADFREQIRKVSDVDVLKAWQDDALFLRDAEGAEQLAGKIRKTLLAQGCPRRS